MDLESLKENSERKLYSSLDEIFQKADLTQAEKDVFLRNQKYCEYWLLRSKSGHHQCFVPGRTNFIKRLAAVIRHLESDSVKGDKKQKIKELFGYRSPIHRVYKTKNGFRTTQNSPTLENTYFELEIMSFFIDAGFKIELIKTKSEGQKIPEFIAIKDDLRISVEAKNLNIDSVLDNFFGDSFIDGFNHQRTQAEKDRGFEGVRSQIQRNYENAIGKYGHINPGEHYIIFMCIYDDLSCIGFPAGDYLKSLQASWNKGEYDNFLGIVIPESDKTVFIRNVHGNPDAFSLLAKSGLGDFHSYVPYFG